jgi:hypothetical protein
MSFFIFDSQLCNVSNVIKMGLTYVESDIIFLSTTACMFMQSYFIMWNWVTLSHSGFAVVLASLSGTT